MAETPEKSHGNDLGEDAPSPPKAAAPSSRKAAKVATPKAAAAKLAKPNKHVAGRRHFICMDVPEGEPLGEHDKVVITDQKSTNRFIVTLNSKHVTQVAYGKVHDQQGALALCEKLATALKAGFSKGQLKATKADTQFDFLSPAIEIPHIARW